MGCKKAKQSCQYLIAGASAGARETVGPIRDAAEDSSEEEEEEEDGEGEEEEEEEERPKASSPIARAFKKLASPLKGLGKRKTTELSPKSVQEREADSSQRARVRRSPSNVSIEVPVVSRSASSFAMPPPSTSSGVYSSVHDPFYVRRLENDLRESREDLTILSRRLTESQEDIGVLLRRHASRESLLKEEIEQLKARLGEGGTGSSGRRGGGAGSSSGRY